jgi:hypothetical protein
MRDVMVCQTMKLLSKCSTTIGTRICQCIIWLILSDFKRLVYYRLKKLMAYQWRSQKFGLGVQLDNFGLEALLLLKFCE